MKKLLFLLLLLPIFSHATIYYVSNAGSNGANGLTPGTAWQTVSKVQSSMASFNAGDFIRFNRGDTFAGILSVTRNGSSGAPITFGAYGAASAFPVFVGNVGTREDQMFLVDSHTYITFDSLSIIDPLIDTTDVTVRTALSNIKIAFTFDNSATHCVAQRCKIVAVGAAMFCANGGSNHKLAYNYIADLTMIVDDPGGSNDFGANYWIGGNTSNDTIIGNICKRCWAHSFDFSHDGGGDYIQSGGGSATGLYIAYNYFFDMIGVMECVGTITGAQMIYNTIISCGQTITYQNSGVIWDVYNNNFVETTAERIGQSPTMFGGSITSLNFKNNNCWITNGMHVLGSGTITHTYNIIHVSGAGSSYGATLSTGEQTTGSNIWFNQTGSAEVWNYNLNTSTPTPALGGGNAIVGLTTISANGYHIGTPPNNGWVGPIPATNPGQITNPFVTKLPDGSYRKVFIQTHP